MNASSWPMPADTNRLRWLVVLCLLCGLAVTALVSSAVHTTGPNEDLTSAAKIARAPAFGAEQNLIIRGTRGTSVNCQKPLEGGLVMRWSFRAQAYAWKAQLEDELGFFLASELLLAAVFFTATFGLGRLVERLDWNANYTRKMLGVVLLAAPILIGGFMPYVANPLTIVVSYLLMLLYLGAFAGPIRRRSRFFSTAFKSLDRPEDRPHTLTWLVTGYIVSSVLLLTMLWWAVPSRPEFAFVAFMGVAVGDLLAGVVGHRYGRHRYATSALFTHKSYTRSWEGSACVFITTLIAVLIVGHALPFAQFVAAFIVLPVVLTVAEAKSPHTWDEPVMFLAAMVSAMAIVRFVEFAPACDLAGLI